MFTFILKWKLFSFKIYTWNWILLMPLVVESQSAKQTIIDVNKNDSQTFQSQSMGRRVVVFDIDGTLCKLIEYPPLREAQINCAKEYHPECPIIVCTNNTRCRNYTHIFLPHLQVLFGYLLEKGTRVAFFSAECKERNEELIPALLSSFWGSEKFEALRAKGQFSILSWDDMRKGKRGEGGYVKDLKAVIRHGESLSNIILIDDDPSYRARDQRGFVFAPDLSRDWDACDCSLDGFKSGVYYMLGLFKTYFEHEKYNKLSLREGFKQLVPKYQRYCFLRICDRKDSDEGNMIMLGLSEVQKQIPNAKYYEAPADRWERKKREKSTIFTTEPEITKKAKNFVENYENLKKPKRKKLIISL